MHMCMALFIQRMQGNVHGKLEQSSGYSTVNPVFMTMKLLLHNSQSSVLHILGKEFEIETDHKPLLPLLTSKHHAVKCEILHAQDTHLINCM